MVWILQNPVPVGNMNRLGAITMENQDKPEIDLGELVKLLEIEFLIKKYGLWRGEGSPE